jgi:hypothetical protein
MPKRKSGFNEEPISWEAEDFAMVRIGYEAEFGHSRLSDGDWAAEVLRPHCEQRLYVLAKYVLQMPDDRAPSWEGG